MIYDIKERTFNFAVRVAKLVSRLPGNSMIMQTYGRQLIRSSASIGANVEEADGTLSKKNFISKLAISRREARESRYWPRLIIQADFSGALQCSELALLEREAEELMLILSSIINKVKDKIKLL